MSVTDRSDLKQTRTKLARFSAVARRFATQLSRCTPELFLKMGRNYHDLLAVEKRLDHFIDALARDEFEATECGRELDGYVYSSFSSTCNMLTW